VLITGLELSEADISAFDVTEVLQSLSRHGSKYFAATHARHQEIEQHDGGHLGGRVEHLDDLGSVAGRVHLVAVPGLIVGLLGLVISRRAPIAECPGVAEDYGRTRSADRNAA
jgi:hypothetical protein